MRYCFADCIRAACWGVLFLAAFLLIVGGAVVL